MNSQSDKKKEYRVPIGANGLFGVVFFSIFVLVLLFGFGLLLESGNWTFKSTYNKLP